jgi:hypothetical protein
MGGAPVQRPGFSEPPAGAYAADASVSPQASFNRQAFESKPSMAPPPGGFQPAYDPAIYGTAHPGSGGAGGGYTPENYPDGPAHMPQGEQGYDDDFAEPPPRRGLKMVMILAGLALLGTGAAFGYRAIFGGSGSVGTPPVIKADTSPSKVAAVSNGEASNKQIYDRVGDAGQTEKVVPREEKPIDVKDASRSATASPRVVFPGLPSSADRADASASAPLGAMPAGPASSEPRKVRTVTIRPDQPLTDAGAPKPGAAPVAPRSAAVPPPPAGAPQRPAPGPGAAQAPAPGGNAPLSLNPQGTAIDTSSRPAPAPRTAVAPDPAPPTRVASVASGAETGGYSVQVSSQRSEAEAQASFRALQSKFPNLLSDRQPTVRRADLGDKGIYFRTMVGPFTSLDEASGFCGNLKSAGGQCVVQRN